MRHPLNGGCFFCYIAKLIMNKLSKYFNTAKFASATFALKYWILWIVIFEIARLFFFASNFNDTQNAGIKNIYLSLLHGLRMDMSIAAYITVPVCLILLMAIWIKRLPIVHFIKIYSSIVFILVFIIVLADAQLFKAWGFRIDTTPLKYLQNPKEAWASMAHLPWIKIVLISIVCILLAIYLFRKALGSIFYLLSHSSFRWWNTFAVIFLLATAIIPIRGGFQLAPLNQSTVYFSNNNFINQASINATWNLIHSLSHKTKSNKNPFNYLSDSTANRIVVDLFANQNKVENIINENLVGKPNLLFIVWESFTEKATHLSKNGVEITPYFNALKNQGIYFSNIYAAGDRTDKGIVALLSGYPSQPTTSIVKTPTKAASLPSLGKQFKSAGYQTGFYYGGELEFANMKAYLMQGGFDKFVSQSDFNSESLNSKWGAHDGVVMEKVYEDLNKAQTPFFYTWLTLSSHEPYEIPEPASIEGNTEEDLFLNSLHYTDKVLGEFIKKSALQPWWKNTIVVIVADHGHRIPHTNSKLNDFKIPFLLLGGALKQQGREISKVSSQVDIAATLLTQLKQATTKFTWSKNILDSSSKAWAYFCFNNGFGFVNANNNIVFDNVGKKMMEQSSNTNQQIIDTGKAIQQLTFQDYLNR